MPSPQQSDGSGWRCFHCPQHCLLYLPGSVCRSVTLPATEGIGGAKRVLTGTTDLGQGEELLPLLIPRCHHTRPGGRLQSCRDILPIRARVLLTKLVCVWDLSVHHQQSCSCVQDISTCLILCLCIFVIVPFPMTACAPLG